MAAEPDETEPLLQAAVAKRLPVKRNAITLQRNIMLYSRVYAQSFFGAAGILSCGFAPFGNKEPLLFFAL
ncbi:MAG: hypothetical protein JO311_07975 [Candidatus Eremiobacteraeota bacterium]|nr:hypothetical protein [Candidatus Eremiobacteraeota bacterium]